MSRTTRWSRDDSAALEFLHDPGPDGRRLGNVRIPICSLLLTQFVDSPPVQRPGVFRINFERRVVVGDRLVVVTHSQKDEPAAVRDLRIEGARLVRAPE